MLSETTKKSRNNAKPKTRDGKARSPIYQKIKDRLRARIDSNELAPGALVPSERDLVVELRVSRGQARQALRDLEMEGYIERFPGRGSFVTPVERRRPETYRHRESRTVMLAYPVLARDASAYIRSIVKAFAESIEEHDYRPVFYYIDQSTGAALRLLDQLEKGELAGLVLWPQFQSVEECAAVKRVGESLFPCVLVDRYLRGAESDFVGSANRTGYDSITMALIDRGHRAIAYISRDFVDTVMEDRYAGYQNALARVGIDIDVRLTGVRHKAPNPSLKYNGADDTAELLRAMFAGNVQPTAILCSDNWTAARVETELGRLGIRVPEDITLAANDDTIDPDGSEPRPWLTIAQDGPEIGRQAAQLLLARIAAPAKVYEQRFVRMRYLFAESGNVQRNEREEYAGKGG
ncbi:MAG: GntR family transcriptional regulator [Candidatus Hydrogenedentes bacterium]|nr:GntR family transcriptional regulator [Candidatus Hydrogenedentota bacterium]